jgi:hypothetical protein
MGVKWTVLGEAQRPAYEIMGGMFGWAQAESLQPTLSQRRVYSKQRLATAFERGNDGSHAESTEDVCHMLVVMIATVVVRSFSANVVPAPKDPLKSWKSRQNVFDAARYSLQQQQQLHITNHGFWYVRDGD